MNASLLGQSFQVAAAVRRITLDDHLVLNAVAKHLPLEPRACILPEERLEAMVLLGDEGAIEDLVREQPSRHRRKAPCLSCGQRYTRNAQLSQQLHEVYQGKCQICL